MGMPVPLGTGLFKIMTRYPSTCCQGEGERGRERAKFLPDFTGVSLTLAHTQATAAVSAYAAARRWWLRRAPRLQRAHDRHIAPHTLTNLLTSSSLTVPTLSPA